MKLAIIGCGGHAQKVHLPALVRLANEDQSLELTACCDLNPQAADSFRQKGHFLRAYSDYSLMLDTEQPDAVVLVTPFTITSAIAVELLNRGYPTLIEKPPGINAEQCATVAQAATDSGVIHQVAFNRRYMPIVNKIKAMIPSKIEHIQYSMYRIGRLEEHFYTTAIHGIDMIGYIAGSPYATVEFSYQPLQREGKDAINVYLHAAFENGATAELSFCVDTGMVHERMLISGQGFTLEAHIPIWENSDTPGLIRLYHGDRITDQSIGERDEMYVTNGFYDQTKAFIRSVKDKKYSPNDIHSAKQSVEIAEAIHNKEKIYKR